MAANLFIRLGLSFKLYDYEFSRFSYRTVRQSLELQIASVCGKHVKLSLYHGVINP